MVPAPHILDGDEFPDGVNKDTPCACCGTGTLADHSADDFTQAEFEVHVYVTAAAVAADEAHRALRVAVSRIVRDEASTAAAKCLKRASRLRAAIRRLAYENCDEDQTSGGD